LTLEYESSGGFLVQKMVIPVRITIPLEDSSSRSYYSDSRWDSHSSGGYLFQELVIPGGIALAPVDSSSRIK
jgi:hypothetical protein